MGPVTPAADFNPPGEACALPAQGRLEIGRRMESCPTKSSRAAKILMVSNAGILHIFCGKPCGLALLGL